jgi:hypothetical protein
VDHTSGIAGIGDIVAEAGEHTSEAEQIGIDVEPDPGGFDPAHAASWEFS